MQLVEDLKANGTLTSNKGGMVVSLPAELTQLAPGEACTAVINMVNTSEQRRTLSSICQLQAAPQVSAARA
jgi:hypothetical protein